MTGLVLAMIGVPLLDQAIKLLLRRSIGPRAHSLGWLGEVRLQQQEIWMTRLRGPIPPAALWALWFAPALAVTVIGLYLPSSRVAVGLLLGGSLSHALETSRRGSVTDCVRLRVRLAFNLADVALVAGAGGVFTSLAAALGRLWV